MIINGTQDALFPLPGVHAAFDKVAQVYAKAGVPDRFAGVLYDGPHEFNAAMQDQAYAWLERWLEPKRVAPPRSRNREGWQKTGPLRCDVVWTIDDAGASAGPRRNANHPHPCSGGNR